MGSFTRKLVVAVPLAALWVAFLWFPVGSSRLSKVLWGGVQTWFGVQAICIMLLRADGTGRMDNVVPRRIRRWILGDAYAPPQ